MKNISYLLFTAFVLTAFQNSTPGKNISETEVQLYLSTKEAEAQIYTEEQQEIIDEYVYNCSSKYSYLFCRAL